MSSADGQDFLAATIDLAAGTVLATVFTPDENSRTLSEANKLAAQLRRYPLGARVALAVFGDTLVDGSVHPHAQLDSSRTC